MSGLSQISLYLLNASKCKISLFLTKSTDSVRRVTLVDDYNSVLFFCLAKFYEVMLNYVNTYVCILRLHTLC